MENENLCFVAPDEILNEITEIHERITEKGYASRKDADRHLSISRKYQVCNTCKQPYREAKMRRPISIPGYGGKEYEFCFSPTCMQCEWMSWMMDPEVNPNLR